MKFGQNLLTQQNLQQPNFLSHITTEEFQSGLQLNACLQKHFQI